MPYENDESGVVATTMPYRLYTDENVLKTEQEKIFSKSWIFACHKNEVAEPGDLFTCEVAGEPVMIIRGRDNQIRAFYNVCPHRGTKLQEEESANKKILQCPYHGWTFQLDGQLHKAPNFKDVPGFCKEQFCLHNIRVEVKNSLVFVNLDPSAQPMDAYFQDVFEDFSQFDFMKTLKKNSVQKRVLDCNWKAFIDNFLECDHCPIAHPSFSDTLDLNKYHIINGDHCNIQGAGVKSKQGKQSLDLDLTQAEVQEGRYYWLWPNVMLVVHPGPANLSTIEMIPISQEQTLGIYTNFSKYEEPAEETKTQLTFAEQVRKEDVELVERQQRGFHSNAFEHGVISPTEHGVRLFHNMIRDVLEINDQRLASAQ